MYQFLRFAAQSLAALCFLFVSNSTLLSQEIALKSKYSYTTPALEAAQQLYSQKKYPEALSAFEKIINEAEKDQNYEEVVYAMEKKALALRRQGRYDEVIITMDAAINIGLRELPRGHLLISKMYYTRGTTDHTLRNYFDARLYLDTALVYYNSSSSYDSILYGRQIEYKYYTYQYSEGSQDTLVKYLGKLIELEQLKQVKKPSPNGMLVLLNNYATIFIQKGDFEQALAYAIRAYKYASENRKKVSVRYYAETQLHLARVLYYKKDYSKAIEIGLGVMPLVEGTPRIEMPEYHSFNNIIGISYMAIGNYEIALPYLNKALGIPVNEGNLFQRKDKAQFYSRVLGNLGLCYINLGEEQKGRRLLEESLEYMKRTISIPSPDFHGNYDRLGDYFFGQKKFDRALNSYDSALRNGLASYNGHIYEFPSVSQTTFSYRDMQTLSKKATSMKEVAVIGDDPQGLLSASNIYVETIHELLMKNRESFSVSEGKLFLSENFKSLYETGIDICFELYQMTNEKRYLDQALAFAKKSKSILFLEQSEEFSLVNSKLLSTELKKLFFESKRKIEKLQRVFYSLIDTSVKSDSVIRVNEEILAARNENKQIKDSITRILASFDISESPLIEPVDLEIDLPKGTALIEFFYGDDHIYVLGKRGKKSSFQKIRVSKRFEEALDGIVNIVSSQPRIDSIGDQVRLFANNSRLLYDLLLKDVLNDFGDGVERLIIVPDEFLSRLPFEVLLARDMPNVESYNQLHYLLKDYNIRYELSSAMLNAKISEVRAGKGFLGIGFKESGLSAERSGLGTLPGTEREINYLESSIKGTYMIGDSGTKKDFLKAAKDYDILHLAIHGQANGESRYESSLIFNGPGENTLNTNDLYVADLNARLVVLSACESGMGKLNKGEGTFSIARGFSIVGVPSVVMSLWKVNDKITSGLMVDMYDSFVHKGLPINESLRMAKLNYLKDSDDYSAHPYYWASFLHLGQNTTNQYSEPWSLQYWLIVIVTLVIVFLIAIQAKKRKRAI